MCQKEALPGSRKRMGTIVAITALSENHLYRSSVRILFGNTAVQGIQETIIANGP